MLYKYMLSQWSEYGLLEEMLIGENHLRTRLGTKVKLVGRRMSGDMNTSLGNGFANLMLALFLCQEQHQSLSGFVEGDDGLFVTDANLTVAMYEELGFTIKIEKFSDPCDASFCGLIFSSVGETIRNPFKFFQTAGWTLSFINAGTQIMMELLRAKALSVLAETPQCPIVGAWAHGALTYTTGYSPRFVLDEYHNAIPSVNVVDFAPSSEVRDLFARHFGVAVSVQLAIEKLLLNVTDLSPISQLLPAPSDVAWFYARYVIVD